MLRFIAIFFSLFLFLFNTNIFSQQCDPFFQKLNSVDNKRFVNIEFGVVFDKISKLSWKKCLLGQQWSNTRNKCIGKIKSLEYSEIIKYLEKNDIWRLPTIKELKFLIHFRCKPAINQKIFDIPTNRYVWSATIDEEYPHSVFIHGLYSGMSNSELTIQKHSVLLVKK